MPTLPAVPAGEGQAPQAGDARFLESDQFQEMLQTYRRLKPLAEEKPRTFKKQLQEFDFRDIYPLMDDEDEETLFDYTWHYFELLKTFLHNAAERGDCILSYVL